MPLVVINGWTQGFRKVSHTEVLRSGAGMPLAQAKAATDRILAGGRVVVSIGSELKAREFAKQLIALGAEAQIVEAT